jgi:hypothetical protein
MEDNEHKFLMEEDIQFTLICAIQTFFEQKIPSEKLKEYFDALNQLEVESDKLIKKEIKDALQEAKHGEVHQDPEESRLEMTEEGNPLINNFVREPSSYSKEVKTRLYVLRKELIMYEMENKHREMYKKIDTMISSHIKREVDDLKKDKEEIMYFMDSNQLQKEEVDQKLLKDHSSKLESSLISEYPNIPKFLLFYAKDEIKSAIMMEVCEHPQGEENKQDDAIEEGENYDDIQEEWYSMATVLQESIYSENTTFWDKSVTEKSTKLIDNLLEVL